MVKVTNQNFDMELYKSDINTLYSNANQNAAALTDPDQQYFLNIIKLNKTTKSKITEIFDENFDRTLGKDIGRYIRHLEETVSSNILYHTVVTVTPN